MQFAAQFHEALQKHFKFNEFRPGQLETLNALMTEGRVLCIQPTGYGKSLLYQLPSVLLNGITIVISPLLALMRDQLDQLTNRFGIMAASINSDQTEEANGMAKHAALAGKLRILFISPEQLDNLHRFEFLLKLPVSLLVVDEAHCISTWGHDFRPSYRQIIYLTKRLASANPNLKILALTATANQQTEKDIKQQLTVNHQPVIVQRASLYRNNIRLSVIPCQGAAMKLATLIDLLKNLQGSGLIYCATRENTETVAAFLQQNEINATAYHAGIEPDRKRQIQKDFLLNKYPVIAATNALGMGIDKSDLRFIIHFDFPGSITAYYQEVGRCGRDGLSADGILLYDAADGKVQNYFIDSSQPTQSDFALVLDIFKTATVAPTLAILKRLTGLHPTKLNVILTELIEQQFIHKTLLNRSQVYQLQDKKGRPDLSRYATQYRVKFAELNAMQTYAEQRTNCFMQILCKSLGDFKAVKCQKCSYCAGIIFYSQKDKNIIFPIASWLERRTVTINLSKKIKNVLPGIAVLDGKLRSADFINFMRERAGSNVTRLGLSDSLLETIKDCLEELKAHHLLSCIVPIPSRTWGAKNAVINMLANFLKIPVLHEALTWLEVPAARQGELLNNDQRQHNVSQRMAVKIDRNINSGSILLFDDYLGSGSTLEEASRVLRTSVENKIIPFAIAAVKWRLGKQGMI